MAELGAPLRAVVAAAEPPGSLDNVFIRPPQPRRRNCTERNASLRGRRQEQPAPARPLLRCADNAAADGAAHCRAPCGPRSVTDRIAPSSARVGQRPAHCGSLRNGLASSSDAVLLRSHCGDDSRVMPEASARGLFWDSTGGTYVVSNGSMAG